MRTMTRTLVLLVAFATAASLSAAPQGSILNYGTGCGSGPLAIAGSGSPTLGNSFDLSLSNGRPSSVGAIFLGATSKSQPLTIIGMQGCTLYTDILVTQGVALDINGASNVVSVVVPNTAALVGAKLYSQGGNIDPGATTLGVTMSDGVEITIGERPAGQLYVASSGSSQILRFSNVRTVSGNTAPDATIGGSRTTISSPRFIYLEDQDDRLYIANQSVKNPALQSVLVYDDVSTKNGNVAPNRTITSTVFSGPIDVTIDHGSDEMYVSNMGGNNVLVFANASSINGAVLPSRVISSSPSIDKPHGILLDQARDTLYLTNLNSDVVMIFEGVSGLSGTVTPNRMIAGTRTQLNQPIYVRIDAAGNLVVGNRNGASMNVYANAATVNGNVAPIRMIQGSSTTFDRPHQILYLAATDELYVANAFGKSLLVFANYTTATGNLAANRVLQGSLTGLSVTPASAVGVAIDLTR